MRGHFSHRYDILPDAQRKIWPQLAAFKERFVLYGGTALALRLGHRQSVDFDFFSDANLEHDTLLVASLEDLMATKVKVLMQRIEKKDYIDIAALISHGVALESGLAGASAIFGNEFSPTECLRALQYFDEPSLSGLEESVKRILKEAVNRVLALDSLPETEIGSYSLK